MAFKDLTGRWLGRYDYAHGGEGVSFEADLVEDAGSLTGETVEPNTFQRGMGAELHAALAGSRTGTSVAFVKTYVGFGQGADPHYTGALDQALTRMVGDWAFPMEPGGWSGRFVMIRKPLAAAQTTRKTAVPQDLEPIFGLSIV
jgi:hypothetical protein